MGTDKHQYILIADTIQAQIESGALVSGQRIPGTRPLARRFGVSINTILNAQKQLELRGCVEAVPRSGFYVRPSYSSKQTPSNTQVQKNTRLETPTLVKNQRIVMDLISAAHSPDFVSLGAALPHEDFLPSETLRLCVSRVSRQNPELLTNYSFPPGLPLLRQTLAKKMILDGIDTHINDIVITSGCHDALILALKAVTKPGDIVALESPTYYGLLQALESMSLKALEIPSSQEGIDLSDLDNACQKWSIKACILVSNFSNPIGNLVSKEKKQQILNLLVKYNVPLIEDDIYGDLAFSGERPPPMASLQNADNVIYCNSFSKTLAPGMRVGWIASRRYAEKISYLKFAQSLGTASVEQAALALYLSEGHYAKHVRQLQRRFSGQILLSMREITASFPKGTQVAQPKGGFVIWVELPSSVDSFKLYQIAEAQGLSIAPGRVFSTKDHYNNCIRLNCALPWENILKPALQKLSAIAHALSINPSPR